MSGQADWPAAIDFFNHPWKTLACGIVETAVNPNPELVVLPFNEFQIRNNVRQILSAPQDDPLLAVFTGLAFYKDAYSADWKVTNFDVGAKLVPNDMGLVVARICTRHTVEDMIKINGIIGIPPTRQPK
jgi:hypothetical protein